MGVFGLVVFFGWHCKLMWQPNLQIRDYAETLHFFMFKRSLVTMLCLRSGSV